MEALRPKKGHVVEVGDDVEFETIGELIGFDFEEELDEPDPIIGVIQPAVIIGGDLAIDGDISSRELPFGRAGFTRDAVFVEQNGEAHKVVVLGNLTVNGNLEVEQYFDLFVAGRVDVHSYRSHSANFVSTGPLTARDIICTEANEEGGIFQPRGARSPLWVTTGYYYDDDVEFEGEEIAGDELNGEHHQRALDAANVALDKPQQDDLWEAIVACIQNGKVDRFATAYRDEESPLDPLESYKGPIARLFEGQKQYSRGFICGFWTEGDTVLAVGGAGLKTAYRSDDGGESFVPMTITVGERGLRDVMVVDGVTWICGPHGLLARSEDGENFAEIELHIEKEGDTCFQRLTRGQGALWVTGAPGAYRSVDGGATWAKVEDVSGGVSRPRDSRYGVLLPSSEGALYLGRADSIEKTALDVEGKIWATACTAVGTILAVSNDSKVHRSTDGGASFTTIDTDAPASLENIVVLDDGRIVTVGEGGAILESTDDGKSFTKLEHPFTDNWIFGLHKWQGNKALLGGVDGLILRYS